jgi:hypothetical protein
VISSSSSPVHTPPQSPRLLDQSGKDWDPSVDELVIDLSGLKTTDTALPAKKSDSDTNPGTIFSAASKVAQVGQTIQDDVALAAELNDLGGSKESLIYKDTDNVWRLNTAQIEQLPQRVRAHASNVALAMCGAANAPAPAPLPPPPPPSPILGCTAGAGISVVVGACVMGAAFAPAAMPYAYAILAFGASLSIGGCAVAGITGAIHYCRGH